MMGLQRHQPQMRTRARDPYFLSRQIRKSRIPFCRANKTKEKDTMYAPSEIEKTLVAPPGVAAIARGKSVSIALLGDEDENEVLAFLGQRPAHTFGIVGFIRNNGIVSPHNRGVFYGCRNANGELEGVALIGHFILFEARSNAAIEAFARTAQTHKKVHMLLGEQEKVQIFWRHYHRGGQNPRLYCREQLFERRQPMEANLDMPAMRLATREDLDLIVPVHARTAFEESGINPLDVDPQGFTDRCARRIEKGQTWVWIEDGTLIFKAEIIADTPEVVYLEGVDVNPDERGKGYGTRCVSHLCRQLLERTESISLLVNEKNARAGEFYRKVGFNLLGYYDTIFLESA